MKVGLVEQTKAHFMIKRAVTMEVNGKVIDLMPEKSGQSVNGTWRKQEYILETDGQYPKKVCFVVWGDKIDQFGIKQGENLSVSIDLESREYNGRWYTDVKAWKVSRSDGSTSETHRPSTEDYHQPKSTIAPQVDEGDIPF